jgi:hypothetical protein
MKKLFTILTALFGFVTGFAQLNTNVQLPLYIQNFWNNNEFWVEPTTWINGNPHQANYVPGYPGQAKTLPDTLVYEFPDTTHAKIRQFQLFDSMGSGNHTYFFVTRKSDNKDTLIWDWQHTSGFGLWQSSPTITVPFECSRFFVVGQGDASYGTQLRVIGDYYTYTEPSLLPPTTFYPIDSILGYVIEPYQITTQADTRIIDQTVRGYSTRFVNRRIWTNVDRWSKTAGDSTYFNTWQFDTVFKYQKADNIFFWPVANHIPDDINSSVDTIYRLWI